MTMVTIMMLMMIIMLVMMMMMMMQTMVVAIGLAAFGADTLRGTPTIPKIQPAPTANDGSGRLRAVPTAADGSGRLRLPNTGSGRLRTAPDGFGRLRLPTTGSGRPRMVPSSEYCTYLTEPLPILVESIGSDSGFVSNLPNTT
uniref:Uncharacterized protein n=1 Tax=Anopheles atroparvus TaxID=41427 RepID=A0A182J1K4_ANOAO